MDPVRLPRIRQAMEDEGLELLLCRNPENVLYLSGYWPVTGWSLAVMPLDGEPKLIVPSSEIEYAKGGWVRDIRVYETEGLNEVWNPHELMARTLEELQLPKGVTVGCELGFETTAANNVVCEVSYACKPTFDIIRRVFDGRLVDASEMLTRLRMVKSEYEIGKVEAAAELAALGVEKLLETVSEGVKESKLAAVAEAAVHSEGVGFKGSVKRARGFAFVMTGENSSKAWYPFNISTDRRVKVDDVILLEFNVCADGYWIDVTRTWILGKPCTDQENMFHTLIEAQEKAYESEHDGVEAAKVDGSARSLIAERGYSRFFPHRLGHGIGLRVHEPPALHPASKDVLKRGMIHTVEPGIYTSRFGIRLEDDVVVQDKGVKNLFEKYKFLSLRS